MQKMRALRVGLLACIALGATACSLSIDQTFAMKEGSSVAINWYFAPGGEIPLDRLVFEGGAVMRINVSTTLLDYLDGTVDGDVEMVDLLFGIPNFKFFFSSSGLICV